MNQDKKPEDLPHYAWTERSMRACPFCGRRKTFCSLKWEERFFAADGRHMITATISCHHCGAEVHDYNPDVEKAVQYATEKWQHRAGDDE